MTSQYIIDRVRAVVPQVSESAILSDINDVQRSFVEESDILRLIRRSTIVNTSGVYTIIDNATFDWTATVMNDGGLKLTPPTDCISVMAVSSSDLTKLDTSVFLAWRFMNGELTLYNRSQETTPLYSNTVYLEIEYSRYPASLLTSSTAFDVPGIFHLGILAGVMTRHDVQNIGNWDTVYRKEIVKAKQYVNKNRRGN